MPQIILQLHSDDDKIYDSANIACYLISDSFSENRIKEIIKTGKMVLCFGDNALTICRQYGLDGVVKEIDESKPLKAQIKHLRESLKNKTLGVIISAHRHEAMLAGEVEPDFIAFNTIGNKNAAEMISWYNELFLIPLALLYNEENTQELLQETDFVIVESKKFENFGC